MSRKISIKRSKQGRRATGSGLIEGWAPNGTGFPAPSGWRLMESEPGATPGFEPVLTGNVVADIASFRAANPAASVYATPVYDPKCLSASQLTLPDQ